MTIILLLICFIVIFFAIGIHNIDLDKRTVLLVSVLTFALMVTVVTELLSFFQALNYLSIVLCWLVIDIGGIFYINLNKSRFDVFYVSLRRRFGYFHYRLGRLERYLLTAATFLFVLEFVQGIIYPPNNRDSLTYHMARIPSWISHQSVDPFPTHIVRQVYQPPLAEYIILHVNMLSRSDYFSASVQFFFLLFSLFAISVIIKQLGLNRNFQIMGFLLGAAIPEVVLQSSSTQNDIVVAFFVLSSFYFFLKSVKDPGVKNYLLLGLSIGFSLLTKGTAYMFIAPILLLFGIDVLIKLFKTKQAKLLLYAVVFVALIPIGINARDYYRNYSYSQNILGIDKKESGLYANDRMNARYFVCNFVKNADCHMGLLFVPRITFLSGRITHKIYRTLRVKIDEPAITYPEIGNTAVGVPGDPTYYTGLLVATHEDFGANFIHFVLIFFSLILLAWYLVKNRKYNAAYLLAIVVILQVCIFCGYLKWQPLGTRLETSIFLLAIPLICFACSASTLFGKIVFRFALPFVIFYAFLLVLFNYNRPIVTCLRVIHGYTLTGPTAVTFDRYKKQFVSNLNYKSCAEYRAIHDDIDKSNYKNIGLILDNNDWEYPLFTDCYTRPLNPVHIMVSNYTKDIAGYPANVDCIASTTINQPFIDYDNKRFVNQSPENTLIWYYKPM